MALKLLLGFELLEARVHAAKLGRAPMSIKVKPEMLLKERLLHFKMLSAVCVLQSVLIICASLSKFDEEPLSYFDSYYFCFTTFSTIGLGDFALGPTDNSVHQFFFVVVQALVIFIGLAAFNSYTSIGTDWMAMMVKCALRPVKLRLAAVAAKEANSVPPEEMAPAVAPAATQALNLSPPPSPPEPDFHVVKAFNASSSIESKKANSSEQAALKPAYTCTRACAESGATLGFSLLFRIASALLCAYVIMLLGALLLYWAESQNEVDVACALRAEENFMRQSMRLPEQLDEVCTT
mmetsp:Transcript_78472/g.155947  ORF Transcript_78472/g.155947 Transcript_78472/m.155947 type:complete len:294 (-) Transcript_78472:357-1238(-)